MTNGWIDIKNTDMMLIMGGNPAENHPCGFKWAVEAKRNRNAKTIVVDPRFTRTATQADLFLQIRAGSDIAFLGGVINYALQNNRIAKEYLVNYTNAAFIIRDGFKLPEDGLFSGFDAAKSAYDRSTWSYQETKPGEAANDLTLENPQSLLVRLASPAAWAPRRWLRVRDPISPLTQASGGMPITASSSRRRADRARCSRTARVPTFRTTSSA